MKPPPVQPLSQLPAAPANTRNAWQHARWTARSRKNRPWQKNRKIFVPKCPSAHIYTLGKRFCGAVTAALTMITLPQPGDSRASRQDY